MDIYVRFQAFSPSLSTYIHFFSSNFDSDAMTAQAEEDWEPAPERSNAPDPDAELGKSIGTTLMNDKPLWKRLLEQGDFVINEISSGRSKVSTNQVLVDAFPADYEPILKNLKTVVVAMDEESMRKLSESKQGPARKSWIHVNAKTIKNLLVRSRKKRKAPDASEIEEGEQEGPETKQLKVKAKSSC